MDGTFIAFAVVASVLCSSSAQTQRDIPRCALSRLDHVNCPYRTVHSRARDNEFTIHHTVLKEDKSGFVRCIVKKRNQKRLPITDLGTEEMRIIYSSGFTIGEYYDNQLLMEYKVACGENELAFFKVTDIDMEGVDTCNDRNGIPRCPDYILIDMGSFGTTEVCGNATLEGEVGSLEGGRFTIIFRSSERNRKPGFRMLVVCFKPEEKNMEGCFRPDEFNSFVCPNNGGNGMPLDSVPGSTRDMIVPMEAMQLRAMTMELLNAVPAANDPNVTDPRQTIEDFDLPGISNTRRRQVFEPFDNPRVTNERQRKHCQDNGLPWSEFVCYASTDCHGAIVLSLPSKDECCAGNGLSFQPTNRDECQNCFTETEFTSPGSKFFLAFFDNLNLQLLSLASTKVRVANLEDSSQTVMVSNRMWNRNYTIKPQSCTEISLNRTLRIGNVGVKNSSILIQSKKNGDLSVTASSYEFTSSDIFHLLPCVYLPSLYEYYAISVQRSNLTQFPPLGKSVFVVVACEGNTQVTITLTQTVTVQRDIVAQKGVPTNVTLDRTETLFVSSIDSLSGSHITSNKPVAVFSGHECGTIPANVAFCDQMVEQIPPTSTWGKEFYTVPLKSRAMDGFKVISSRNDNILRGACSLLNSSTISPSLLIYVPHAGKEVDFNISSDHFCHLESDYPVLLVQFSLASDTDNNSIADVFMAIVPPVKQYRNSYIVNHFQERPFEVTHFLNIVFIHDQRVTRNQFLMDGQPFTPELQWTEIRCRSKLMATCASGVQLEIGDQGIKKLSHLNPIAKFVVIPYSFGFRTGRGSFSGTNQKPIAVDTVTIDALEYRVPEGSDTVNITLSRTGDMLDDIIIPLKTHSLPDVTNSARADADFFQGEVDVLFPAATNSVVVTLPLPKNGMLSKKDEVFEVYLGASPGVLISPNAYVNVTIVNDDLSLKESAREVDESTVFAALRNREACNPVFRAQSRATLKYYRDLNESAVEALETFPLDCSMNFTLLICTSEVPTLPGRTTCRINNEPPFICEPFHALPPSTIDRLIQLPSYNLTVTAINCNGQTGKVTIEV